jgi:hypothetical protein
MNEHRRPQAHLNRKTNSRFLNGLQKRLRGLKIANVVVRVVRLHGRRYE